jgi:hypothetical protein
MMDMMLGGEGKKSMRCILFGTSLPMMLSGVRVKSWSADLGDHSQTALLLFFVGNFKR